MKKHLRTLTLICCSLTIAISIVFVYSTHVFASGSCKAEVECIDGSTVYCEVDSPGLNVSCSASGSCVACNINGTPAAEPTCCPGSGNGDY